MSIRKYFAAIAKALEEMPPNATTCYFLSKIITVIVRVYRDKTARIYNEAKSKCDKSANKNSGKVWVRRIEICIRCDKELIYLLALLYCC